MMPGAIALHVTLYRAPSRATDFANPMTPIFVVAYAVCPNPPMSPAIDAMQTIRPQRRSRIPGKTALVILYARAALGADRKSTRLNSSHSQISYAVFCLKKKKKVTIHVYTHGQSST